MDSLEPRLKRCRSCGRCSEKMSKCQTCKNRYQIKWSESRAFHTFHCALRVCFINSLQKMTRLFGLISLIYGIAHQTRNSEFNAQHRFFYAGTTAANHAKFLTGRATKNIISLSNCRRSDRVVSTCTMPLVHLRCAKMELRPRPAPAPTRPKMTTA